MAVSLTSADQALKSVYLDVVSEQLNYKTNPFLSRINRTSNDVWGKDIRKLVSFGMNGGIGAGTETGPLPVSNGLPYGNFVLPLKNFYGTIEISDKAMRASANHVGAFINLLNAEMESLIKSCSFNFGRMLFGDGSGIIATVLKSDINGCIKVDSVKNLFEGMVIDFVSPSHVPYWGSQRTVITSIDRETNTIQVTGDYLFIEELPKGSLITVQGSLDKELTGLEAIFSSEVTELYGLDKMEHKFLQPYIKGNQGKITENDIQKAMDEIEKNTGNTINYILCSFGVRRALGNIREYKGIPIVADRFCPEGTLYLLNTDDFALHQLCDWSWLEHGDGNILQQVPGRPIYTATLVKYADLMCSKPCGQGKICGITEK